MSVSERFIDPQFCDDIRQEVGNKFSLIGCYSGSMIVEKLPAVLPKLCVMVKVCTSIDRPWTSLTVMVKKDGVVVSEINVPDSPSDIPNRESWMRRMTFHYALAMSPFPIEGPCKLTVEARCGDSGEELHGGTFEILSSEQQAERQARAALGASPVN